MNTSAGRQLPRKYLAFIAWTGNTIQGQSVISRGSLLTQTPVYTGIRASYVGTGNLGHCVPQAQLHHQAHWGVPSKTPMLAGNGMPAGVLAFRWIPKSFQCRIVPLNSCRCDLSNCCWSRHEGERGEEGLDTWAQEEPPCLIHMSEGMFTAQHGSPSWSIPCITSCQ